jgi:hypothetical protein
MKYYKTLFFTITFLISTNILGQDAEMIPKVSSYLESNGTTKQYKNAYLELLNLMEKQFPKSDRNSDGWLYLERNQKKALQEIQDLLVPVYIKYFNKSDIDKMKAFYATDAGKQLLEDKNMLTDSQSIAVNTFFNSEVGIKLKEKQEVLSLEIASVSEYWSKDLYQTAVLLLKE